MSSLAKPLTTQQPSNIWRYHQQFRCKGRGVGMLLVFAPVPYLMLLLHGSCHGIIRLFRVETRNNAPSCERKEPKSRVECDDTQADVLVALLPRCH